MRPAYQLRPNTKKNASSSGGDLNARYNEQWGCCIQFAGESAQRRAAAAISSRRASRLHRRPPAAKHRQASTVAPGLVSRLQLPHRRPAHTLSVCPRESRFTPGAVAQELGTRPCCALHLRTRPRPSRAGGCPPGHSPAAVLEYQPSEQHGRRESERVWQNREGIGEGPVGGGGVQ